ncbi:LamG-like jellyroll fold domain-containing protein [Actinoplanes sp. NPDC049802]|uniref:LamG-like jellyroll fold domain-containing protein n=1 Tax=Actinoplanes sp. NPDC049802 TaxID=3154742 RepID=UPI0033E6A027
MNSSRTEFSQVTAQPDGRLRFESSVVPERARRGAEWAEIDLELRPGNDGRLRPAVSVADVAFSAGGSGPLATLTRAGRTMTMSWPGTLPPPTVSGASATYADVLDDVDLVVRATATGFTHTIVIRTAAAAAQAGVREIRFELGGDAEIQSGGGTLRAIGAGSVLAATEPALMWDSRRAPEAKTSTERSTASPAVSVSTAEGAGDAARLAPVSVDLAGDDLVLRPDPTLLQNAAFPLYVDPTWSVYKAKWAYATENGSSNTDYSVARVGKNPDNGVLYRSFFQFPTTANGVSLKSKHIESARVEMNLDHSWSCDNTVTSMYATAAINASPKASWSAMKLGRYLDTASGHANESGGCDSIQGDMKMNFTGANVTKIAQDAATGGWTALYLGFTARASDGSGESTQDRWKKFFPNDAKLFVDYDTRPGAPTYLQAAGVACGSGVLTIGTLTPTFSAIFPDADKSDSLTGVFEWIEVPAAGMGSVTNTSPARRTAPPNKTSVTPGARATSATVTAVKNKTYAFRAKGIDKAPYSLTSNWSAWCQFKVDTTVPAVTASVVTLPTGPGGKARIRIQSTATDVTKFQYGWDAATKPVTATGTNPKVAEVDVTAPRFGTNVLLIKAIDKTLNEGNGSVEFEVGRPSPPVARWGLETYPGISQAAALADRAPAPVDSPLTAGNISWSGDVRLREGQTASFNGTSSAGTTASDLVNTTGSFSVAGWVRLGALPATDMKFATQDGTDAAGFEIGVRRSGSPLVPYWSFLMKDTSAQSSTTVAAMSTAAITTADVGRWTHVAGTFDAPEKKLRLYVNGVLVSQVDRVAAPWAAAGRFAVGRGFGLGAPANFWNGSIADVQVFDRVLVPQDFTGQLASMPTSGGFDEPGILTPIQVGAWNFEAAYPCFVTDLRDTCEVPDTTTAWGRWLALSRGSDVAAGRSASNQGLWLDDRYFPDNDGNYLETTTEYGRSAVKTGLTGPDGDGNEFTRWQDRPVLRTDQSFTVSAWVMLGSEEPVSRTVIAQRGTHESAFFLKYRGDTGTWEFVVAALDATTANFDGLQSTSKAEAGVWTHLTGVYDAARQHIRIYVNGTLEGTAGVGFTPFNATGSLLVGRNLYHDAVVDQWYGGIDDVAIYQGAMTEGAVSALFDAQAADVSGGNVLGTDQTLHEREALRSSDGTYHLWMQEDGNLVLYQNATAIWATNTTGNPGASLVMQGDGNLVLYRSDRTPLWSTGTWNTTADRLVLYDDGDLALLDTAGQVVWRR